MTHPAAAALISDGPTTPRELISLCREIVSGAIPLWEFVGDEWLRRPSGVRSAFVLGWLHNDEPGALMFVEWAGTGLPSIYAIEGPPPGNSGALLTRAFRRRLHKRMNVLALAMVSRAAVPSDFEPVPVEIALEIARHCANQTSTH